ncbi:hypothetical protein [Glaciibacter superstes]|uniref:hypothetical protein n=1 Tax=Glaciibacter superstes TaxID=501023 RepID=UPI0012FC1C09|nr:hypothetical protein [Glaciibacter superstes]
MPRARSGAQAGSAHTARVAGLLGRRRRPVGAPVSRTWPVAGSANGSRLARAAATNSSSPTSARRSADSAAISRISTGSPVRRSRLNQVAKSDTAGSASASEPEPHDDFGVGVLAAAAASVALTVVHSHTRAVGATL